MYIPSNYYNPSFAFIAANSSSTEASLPFDVYLSARVEAALVCAFNSASAVAFFLLSFHSVQMIP